MRLTKKIIDQAIAQAQAEMDLAESVDAQLEVLGLPRQSLHELGLKRLSPQVVWKLSEYVLDVAHRAGVLEAFKHLLVTRAIERDDEVLLEAFGVEHERRSVGGADSYATEQTVWKPAVKLDGDRVELTARELVRRAVEFEADSQTEDLKHGE